MTVVTISESTQGTHCGVGLPRMRHAKAVKGDHRPAYPFGQPGYGITARLPHLALKCITPGQSCHLPIALHRTSTLISLVL